MGLEDVIVSIGSRVKSTGREAYLFYRPSKPGIDMRLPEGQLRQYLEWHPQSRYFIFGLGMYEAWKRIQSPLRTEYNGVITSLIRFVSPSPTLNTALMRHIGMHIERPPRELPQADRKDLEVSVATHCQFDFFFPELISIGYGTMLGVEVAIATHLNMQDYFIVGEVNIGRSVLLGAKSVIGPGVTIGDRAQINAGSYVTSDVPPGAIYSGNPARLVGRRKARWVEMEDGLPRMKQGFHDDR
ncbi:acyltransferase [Candidatus Woesearchaeota archaeon]|nr:acyltransferase [Candidatus Woesearchaeota archaeon]